jgi:hypothetical protein
MTTKAELKKFAKPYFTAELQKRGFSVTPKSYSYVRNVNDVWHLIIPEFTADGTQMDLLVTVWVPEFSLQPYELGNLPNEVAICCGGRLGKSGPSSTNYDLWPAKSLEECNASFPLILKRFDEVAVPWFDRIQTREDLAKNINPLSLVDRFGNKTVDKIWGRNLLYRDQVKPIGT